MPPDIRADQHHGRFSSALEASAADLAPAVPTESPQEKLLRRLCAMLSTYTDADQIEKVCDSFRLADRAHHGQYRKNGEPYICHPLSVAMILADMRMDSKGIMAAILHDVIEDTHISKEKIAERFGEQVAELVDGVTKLTQLGNKSRAEAQAENVRKMFLATARDLRVIMVKLADRTHNMRTLKSMPLEAKKRIATETLEIYAPIAIRLGMDQIRRELEDHGFAAKYPMRHRILDRTVKKRRGHRKEVLATIESTIKKRLTQDGLQCQVIGREKDLYSIYRKMKEKGISFSEVFDVYAFRIVVDEVGDCYRALGLMHALYKPLPGRFKDYIALPKANGYQSLHTILVGPYGFPLEIQIRTRGMHRQAESGIAAHWLYKADDGEALDARARAHEWIRELLETQKDGGNSQDFIENLKVDLFSQEVFVFTPRGDIIKLPKGATIIDFAYAVHTDIGNSCISARVDRQLMPLQTPLANGQTIEIIRTEWARPNPLWLKHAATAKARSAIRTYFKHFKSQEAIDLGRRLLEKEFSSMRRRLDDIPSSRLDALLAALDYSSLDQLLEDIGLGNRMPVLVARRLCQDDINAGIKLSKKERGSNSPLAIKGTEGMVVNLAKCCRPIPGDPIIGFFNPGKGIAVHLNDCRNVTEIRKRPTNWLELEWDRSVKGDFSMEIRMDVKNQRGTLATIASTISRQGSNIESVSLKNQDDPISSDFVTLTVHDRTHLARIMRQLKKLPIVLRIARVRA
jgi:GTP diphosphokinase / guanosine-3',5'-bis(diphosphate) 3'-diphosphatase